jgi:hypothetical protein
MTFILPGGIGQFQAAVIPFSAWDPAHAYAGSTFSNNNRTLISSSGMKDCRGILSHNSGKFYFEVTFATPDPNTAINASVGLVVPSWVPSGTYMGDLGSLSLGLLPLYNLNWYTYFNQALEYQNIGVAPVNNDVGAVAVDFVTTPGSAQIYFRAGLYWSSQGTSTTTFNASLPDHIWAGSPTLFPGASATPGGGGVTLNVGNTAFVRAPPAGFVAWG